MVMFPKITASFYEVFVFSCSMTYMCVYSTIIKAALRSVVEFVVDAAEEIRCVFDDV